MVNEVRWAFCRFCSKRTRWLSFDLFTLCEGCIKSQADAVVARMSPKEKQIHGWRADKDQP